MGSLNFRQLPIPLGSFRSGADAIRRIEAEAVAQHDRELRAAVEGLQPGGYSGEFADGFDEMQRAVLALIPDPDA